MRLGRITLISACVLAGSLPLMASTRTHRGPTARRINASKGSIKHSTAKPKLIGQRGIDDERATELQNALIRAGYLTGEPSGHWDAQTEAAMGRLQADNGWQTKLVPDSRAIIKLGLGPSPVQQAPSVPAADQTGSIGTSANGFLAAR